jgi:hypothetical protein
MSTINGISNVGGTGMDFGADGMQNVSADALLAYCQMQLDGLDGEIKVQTDAQNKALKEREAVQQAQQVLEQFGTDGPQNATDMKTCYDALGQVIDELGPNDPAAEQVSKFRAQMCSQYQYETPRPMNDEEKAIDANYKQAEQGMLGGLLGRFLDPQRQQIEQVQTVGQLGKAPDTSKKEWTGTTDALNNIAGDIKDGAEIQMLQLQDLVAKRQTAVQLITNMMSKMDDSTLSIAKNV